jgi:hypothetical protein
MFDRHHEEDMEVVVIIAKNGDDDGKVTSLCISTQSQKKFAIRDTAREKNERLKSKKQKRKAAVGDAAVFRDER